MIKSGQQALIRAIDPKNSKLCREIAAEFCELIVNKLPEDIEIKQFAEMFINIIHKSVMAYYTVFRTFDLPKDRIDEQWDLIDQIVRQSLKKLK